MSEYQYYEFRTVDHHLDQEEMDELRGLSTRAEITPTSFTNTYHWGDFKGDPTGLMHRYFDAFVYVANWGTHWLMFRVPRGSLDAGVASTYCDDKSTTIDVKTGHILLEFSSEDEDDWMEGGHWMASLISIRAELMRGDLRALYLGWLGSIGGRDVDDDQAEPPVPPGLAKLSAALRSLAEFLRVDDELIEVAAAGSVGEPPAEPSRSEMARWVKGLPAAEKEAYLLRFLAEEGDIAPRAELSRRFRESTAPADSPRASGDKRRTVGQLLEARDALLAEKDRKAAERAVAVLAKREREEAEARVRHLDTLARREPSAWREVETLIATKSPKRYDRAVELLVDLRDLAARTGRAAETRAKIVELRRLHASKPSLLKRFDDKSLGK